MDDSTVDKLAFAILAGIRWAVDGGKVETLPKVHEELSNALRPIFGVQSFPSENRYLHVRDNLIDEMLVECKGNKSLAARKLGINRNTIHNRIKERQQA